MTYRLKVNQQWKIVVALIVIPLFIVFLYVALVLSIKGLPDWTILVSAFIVMALSIASTLFTISRWLTVECEIELDASGLSFKLLRETPFMHLHAFRCNWENIDNTSLNEDAQNGKTFYTVRFRQPGMTLYLTELSDDADGTGSDFWETLNKYVEQHNNSTLDPRLTIRHIGFYDRPWAKVLTYFTLGFSILIVLASVFGPGQGHWWRVAGFSAYAIPWLVNYYSAKKKQKQYPGS